MASDPYRDATPDSKFYRAIPTTRVKELLERELVKYEGERGVLAANAGISERRLWSILNLEKPNTIFDTVDGILLHLDLEYLWHIPAEDGGFADYYEVDVPPPAVDHNEQQLAWLLHDRAARNSRKRAARAQQREEVAA